LATIRLEGLSVFGHHGAYAHEKEAGVRLGVDLECVLADGRAESSDRLEDTAHYDRVHDTVVEVVGGQSFNLLEALGARLAETVLERFPFRSVTVRLTKHNLAWTAGGRAVVEVVRERRA
jgi:dihydroneopterin aldolase